MSVPKSERSESKVRFLSNFHKLRKETLDILMRDFGIKKKHYTVEIIQKIYEISPEDTEALKAIMDKYGINNADIDKYPVWIVEKWRDQVMDILQHLGVEIELANNIFMYLPEEVYERRLHWDAAIGYCHALKDKLHEIITSIKVNVGAYEQVAILLQDEIKLLKGVRKSDLRHLDVAKGNN